MNSKLSEHKYKKGKFITPFNELMSEIGRENSWYHGRLPEYLWLALIVKFYGRKEGLEKCYFIIKKLRKIVPEMFSPKFSIILHMNNEMQTDFYDYILEYIEIDVLSPLTTIFTYSKYQCFASKFFSDVPVEERVKRINIVLKETSDHQSNLSTDIRFLVLYFDFLSGRLHVSKEHADLILEYPKLDHSDEKMRMIRPMVRVMELAPIDIDPYNTEFLDNFWEGVSRMSDCELIYINFKDEPSNASEYIDKVKTVLQYYNDLLVSSNPLDNKMLVLLSIATYSYKRLLELVNHSLYNTISGRSTVRVLIENYIMMKYLLQNESTHEDIWTEYQYYGIGQYKLIVERYVQSGKQIENSHVLYDYLDILVNEYKNKEFIDMDTTYFGKQNVRAKAICVNEKDLFDYYYDYDSAFEHGLWGAIRESSLIKCNSPSHQYHCVPDINDNQKMPSVWNDSVSTMNKTFTVLKSVYGLPSHLNFEDNTDGE
ncbi:DUF5677 domain-containing protein [Lacrimispora sp.]|uniref:DUF5677 domain-containing protein n=1 Tax=Lacrimispora sp. TaxID=2719234 RepID=UPI0028AD1F54|nr:DUF5677 domain-containing protein [Lacrimispora sp.]